MKEKKKVNSTMIIIFVLIGLVILGVIYFAFIKNDEDNYKSFKIDDYTKCTKDEPCTFEVKNKKYSLVYEEKDYSSDGIDFDRDIIYLNNKEVASFTYPGKNLSAISVFKDLLVFETHVGADVGGTSVEFYNLSGNKIREINELEDIEGMILTDYKDLNMLEVENDKLIMLGSRRYHYGTLYEDSLVDMCNTGEYTGEDFGMGTLKLSDLIADGKVKLTDPLTAKYEITYEEVLNNGKPKLLEVIEIYEDYVSKSCTNS